MTLTRLLPQTARQSHSGPRAPLFFSLSLFSTGLFIFPQLLVGVRRVEAEHRKGDLQGDFKERVLPVTKALDRASS